MTIHSVLIQKLLSTNAHLGRRVAAHHFKIYSCGIRNAMTIIDSDKTIICLRNACSFISHLLNTTQSRPNHPPPRFLFINTNPLFDEIITQMTQAIQVKNDTSWRLGGFLTNSSSPKKFRGRNKKLNLTAAQAPDCIVILDGQKKTSVILEADRLQVPIVGLVDSSMPWDIYKRITYPVPANDSVQFVYLFCNLITKTFLYEKKKLNNAAGSEGGAAATAKEAQIEEDVEGIEKSEGKIFVLPYENLVPVPEDSSDIKQLLDKLVVLKLNGSLGSNMGFHGPKSSIKVTGGLTCLDLFINQIEALNSRYGCNIPLLLVDEINTHDITMKVLEKHSNKNIHTLVQSQHYDEDVEDLEPVSSEGRVNQELLSSRNHKKALLSLKNSGKLDVLLSQGKEYVLVLSSDNLADVVDPKILNHLIENNIEYCREVMPTSSDMKDSGIEIKGKFESEDELKVTDTMWMSMNFVERLVERSTLTETVSLSLDKAFAIDIPESRHLPVETTSDLLILQSDLYSFSEGTLTRNAARVKPNNPSIELGPEFQNVDEFHRRISAIPSIIELDSLKVIGDVWFGPDVTLKGKVTILARPGVRIEIPAGSVLENKVITSPGDVGGRSS